MVLAPFKQASYELHAFKDSTGAWHSAHILLACFLADLEEAWDCTNIKHAGAKFTDIKYLIPKDDLASCHDNSSYACRTEKDHRSVVALCKSLVKKKGCKGDAERTAATRSIQPEEVSFVCLTFPSSTFAQS